MSSTANVDRPTCTAQLGRDHDPDSNAPSEGSETTTTLGKLDGGGGKSETASSITLQDAFPRVDERTQKIPSAVIPALLQGVGSLSPPRRASGAGKGVSPQADDDAGVSADAVPPYSVAEKEKCWARKDDDDDVRVGSSSPPFHLDRIRDSAEDWVVHTRPILQDYAERQTSLPLGRRLQVSIDEPSQFILGAIQLLVNRDREGCTERSRQIGPQLMENFVDIDRWAKEYFRSRHGTQSVDSGVPTLLTVVMNNFYEGQVQLIDRLVEFALENMRFCGRSNLTIEDFAFGFDFKMSQDLPFYVETSSRIRKAVPIRAVGVLPTVEPVTTNSGRRVKPTVRAQAAAAQAQTSANGGRNKGTKQISQVQDKRAGNDFAQKTSLARRPSNRTVPGTSQSKFRVLAPAPPKSNSEHTKHRPAWSSNLGPPPTLPGPSSTPGNSHPRSDVSCKSEPGASASADSTKSHLTAQSSPCLKIVIPGLSLPASTSDPGEAPRNRNSSADASRTTNRDRGGSYSGEMRTRDPRNRRGRGRKGSSGRTEISEAAAGGRNSITQPTGRLAGAGEAVTTVAVIVDPPTLVDEYHRSEAGTCPGCGADNNIATYDDGPCSHTGNPLDPGHSQEKKRKLDDCEDWEEGVSQV